MVIVKPVLLGRGEEDDEIIGERFPLNGGAVLEVLFERLLIWLAEVECHRACTEPEHDAVKRHFLHFCDVFRNVIGSRHIPAEFDELFAEVLGRPCMADNGGQQ